MLAFTANLLVRTLLAPECLGCGAVLPNPLSGPVCAGCWRTLPVIAPPCCARCGDAVASWRAASPLCPRCRRRPMSIALARSAGVHDGALRALVHAFKFEGRRALGPPLAARMREAGTDVLAGADAVIPVPLHPWRSLTRGFNQADDLARGLGLPVWRVLRRARLGVPQAGLPASRRSANVRAAFVLKRRLGCRSVRHLLCNRVVVLVDDVMTTGATLEACGRVLRAAGVRSVRALTVARAVAARVPRSPPRPRPSTVPRR